MIGDNNDNKFQVSCPPLINQAHENQLFFLCTSGCGSREELGRLP